jgi:hypothetical protein
MGLGISRHFAVAAADADVRSWVTLEPDEVGAPLRFYFLRWIEDGTNVGFKCVGHAFNPEPISREAVKGRDIDQLGPTSEQERWVKTHLRAYQAVAERAMIGDVAGARRAHGALVRAALMQRAQGKPWTDEELEITLEVATILGDAGLSQLEICQAFGWKERSTLYRAVRRARRRERSAA